MREAASKTAVTAIAVAVMMTMPPRFEAAAQSATVIPDLSAGGVAWRNEHNDFILPASGPGPVTWDPAHPYFGNGSGRASTVRVADLNNPILMPWVKERLQKFNADALAGKPQFTPIARCWPSGVPGAILLRRNPMFIAQTAREVTILYQSDHQVRHIYMNVPHSAKIQPSWYGESVGYYDGDTLVVDTIGITPRVAVDYYSTPHTDKLHVIERYRRVDGGKVLEVKLTVEDPGAFTTAWTASQRYEQFDQAAIEEVVCAEGEAATPPGPEEDIMPIPKAARLDF